MGEIRRRFHEYVAPYRLPREDVEWVKVALSEAATNAICHGSPRREQNQVHVVCELYNDTLVIEVTDESGVFQTLTDTPELPRHDEWKPSGRGLVIMKAVMDEVRFEPGAAGTRVRMVKRFSHAPAAEGREWRSPVDLAVLGP